MQNKVSSLMVTMMGCFLVLSCVSFAETPGERFRKVVNEMAELCISKKLKPTDSRCAIPNLKPADPLATPEGRFAHSIKIPNPVPEDSGYKPGMAPQEYFEHLCKTEAGEFIFKAVENVEGIFQMRPREEVMDSMHRHLYALEDPAGYSLDPHTPQDYFVQPPIGKYEFLELPDQSTDNYRRYYRDPKASTGRTFSAWINGRHQRIPYIVATEETQMLKSQYGYTWRGIDRPNDRELGIAGGEVIVLDVRTKEVLAVRREYFLGDLHPAGIGFEWKHGCPNVPKKMTNEFVQQVLKPKPSL
ncbi:hypothetical protein [Nitrospira calida]|jgi:hypothetical protein